MVSQQLLMRPTPKEDAHSAAHPDDAAERGRAVRFNPHHRADQAILGQGPQGGVAPWGRR